MAYILTFILTFLRRKKWLLISTSLVLLVVFLSAYYLFRLSYRNQVLEGVVGTHEERDLPETALNLISRPLIKVDKTGSPSAELAQSWEANPEATVYKVKLKTDLKWSDGTPLKASQIYLSIPDVEISAPDDLTLQFKLAETFSPFPTLLNKPVLRKAANQFGFELVGVGPYQVDSIRKDGPFVKRLNLKSGDESLPKVSMTFYPNEKIAKTAFKLGEVQTLLGLNETTDISFNNTSQKSFTNYRQIVTIFLNTEDPNLSDENLRLGLAFAAPEIPGTEIAKTSLSPQSWAFNSTVKDFLNNKEKAAEYLKKVQKGKDEGLTLTATSSLAGTGQQVVDAWNSMGLKAVLRPESGIPQNFQALLITQNIPADPDQYSLWHSTQKSGTNISKISSPRIDKDLEDGRKITDPATRKQKYQDFQKILADQSPAIFLYFPKYHVIYMKKVEKDLDKVLQIQLANLN